MLSVLTSLVRIRFSHDFVRRLDAKVDEVRKQLKRDVSRASLVRALALLAIDTRPDDPRLLKVLHDDPVKRGRSKASGSATASAAV